MTPAIDPKTLPTRANVTDENRAIWAEVLGVPPEHVETFLFDLPGASDGHRSRD